MNPPFHLDAVSIAFYLAYAFLLYAISLVVYRLYFHPLSQFPGRNLAAASKWYEFYFDVLKSQGGQYSEHVNHLHDRYGPILRTNPDELHIRDSSYYEVLYSGKRDKWPPAAHMAGNKEETFAMVPHELHRKQRARNMPLMGKRAVLDSVPMLTYQLCKLKAIFVAAAQSGDALYLGVTFLAFTTDVVGRHFFQQSLGMQDDIVEARQWKTATHNMATSTPFIKQFPWIVNSVLRIPSRILKALAPADMAPFLGFHTGMQDRAKVFLDTVQRESREPQGTEEQHPEVDGTEKRNRSATLFHSIYKSNAPPEERSFTRLFHEGVNIIAAGSETTARLLTRVMYELTANPNAFIKARREVNEAADRTNKLVDGLTLVELERLPWLTAAIKESLRVAAIISSRLPLCPHEPLQYRMWTIPAMVSVCPSAVWSRETLI